MSDAWILRRLEGLRRLADGVELDAVALPAIQLPHTPGWLTGEPLLDQGVEVTMPNLPPELPLPTLEERAFVLRATVVPGGFRIVVAPAGARVLAEAPGWLGIVTASGQDVPAHTVEETPDAVVLTSGAASLVLGRSQLSLQVRAGEPVLRTAERLRQVAGFPMAPPLLARPGSLTLNLELVGAEDILGFGEQFGRLVKNGQALRLRVEDALGTGTGLAYKPVPVWHSTQGYSGFLNTGATVDVDAGHTMPSVLGLTVADEALDVYLFTDPDPAERLGAYGALTGTSPRPPLWAFGYWMGRCRYHSAAEMEEVARRLRAEEVPADVLHLDPDWLIVDRLNTDFLWNTGRFGDRRAFIERLAAAGFRLSVWELPYLDPASPRYAEARDAGYLVHATDGSDATLRGTPTPDGRPRGILDFTNPDARAWWQGLHADFFADGVAVFKTDFGEGCPDDVALADGTPANHAHNLFPLRYNGAIWEATRRFTGRPALVWGRSGWAGSQRYPGQWGGDAESTVAGLQATLRAGLSYALSAPGYWSHDIGGFFGPELTPGLYVRWTQFGAFSPLMRAHGLRPREPWEFGADALAICRDWIRLRYSLLPYLWQVGGEVARRGLPFLRPLSLHDPDDPVTRGIDDEYLLGPDLLVAPILDDQLRTVRRRVYLPAGRWFRLTTDEVFQGSAFHEVDVAIDDFPVFVRDGAAVPRLDVTGARNTDDLLGRPWTLHLYGDAEPREMEDFNGAWHPVADVVRHPGP